MDTIKSLIEQTAIINTKYAKLEEASRYAFNIFSILRQESDEVGLHSNFIAELLNPDGSHGNKDAFQFLFFKMLRENGLKIEDSRCTVQTEALMGNSGRIDILLKNSNQVLIIENKIYAQDQPKQLQRYHAAFSDYPDDRIHLVYLTLDGRSPSDESRGMLSKNRILNISYENNILNWIDLCAKEAYHTPHLRETIIQYMNLIKNLTGQSLVTEHKMEIKELLLRGDNLESAIIVGNSIKDAKIEVQKVLWKDLIDSFKKKGFVFNFVKADLSHSELNICDNYYDRQNPSRFYGIEYKVMETDSYSIHLYIEVEWRLYYGFTLTQNGIRETNGYHAIDQSLQRSIDTLTSWDKSLPKNNSWIAWRYTNDKINFMDFNERNTVRLGNPDFRKEWIGKTTNEIIEIIESFKNAMATQR